VAAHRELTWPRPVRRGHARGSWLISVPASSRCPSLRLSGTAPNQLEQAVARADIPPAVGLQNNGRPCSTDAWIHDAEKNSSCRKPCGISRQQIGRWLGIADWSIGEEVDNGDAWRRLMQHGLHLTRIGAVQPEICEQHDQVINSSANPSAMAGVLRVEGLVSLPSKPVFLIAVAGREMERDKSGNTCSFCDVTGLPRRKMSPLCGNIRICI
jgi:hypothetical protein